jgi:hypothetical protein
MRTHPTYLAGGIWIYPTYKDGGMHIAHLFIWLYSEICIGPI